MLKVLSSQQKTRNISWIEKKERVIKLVIDKTHKHYCLLFLLFFSPLTSSFNSCFWLRLGAYQESRDIITDLTWWNTLKWHLIKMMIYTYSTLHYTIQTRHRSTHITHSMDFHIFLTWSCNGDSHSKLILLCSRWMSMSVLGRKSLCSVMLLAQPALFGYCWVLLGIPSLAQYRKSDHTLFKNKKDVYKVHLVTETHLERPWVRINTHNCPEGSVRGKKKICPVILRCGTSYSRSCSGITVLEM